MKVLGLCSYPVESAATRYRLVQFVEPLAKNNIELTIFPFLDSEKFKQFYKGGNKLSKIISLGFPVINRLLQMVDIRKYDLIFIQREAAFFGPAFFEWFYQKIGNRPMILDLDDATYISYVSPTYGKIGSFFKFFGKTDNMIKRADLVICGNRFIAEYVENKGTKTVIVPTVVDTDKFCPSEKDNKVPVIGWIGTHSTFPLLESVFPVLQKLAKKYEFVLKIVGAGREHIELDGVNIENQEWNLEREIADFQSLDIGLYPITTSSSASDEWLLGKSGFKAIQYMAVGIPFVVTPIGVCAEIGIENKTHINAVSTEDWYNALDKLLSDSGLRKDMGKNGRKYSLEYFTLDVQSEKIAGALREVVGNI